MPNITVPADAIGLPTPRRAFLRQLAAASVMVIPTAVEAAAPSADAELLALGERLRRAWLEENEACALNDGVSNEDSINGVFFARSGAIVDEIEALPAVTLAGLKVKALAFSWCHCGEDIDVNTFNDKTTDVRLAGTIVRDLLKMGA